MLLQAERKFSHLCSSKYFAFLNVRGEDEEVSSDCPPNGKNRNFLFLFPPHENRRFFSWLFIIIKRAGCLSFLLFLNLSLFDSQQRQQQTCLVVCYLGPFIYSHSSSFRCESKTLELVSYIFAFPQNIKTVKSSKLSRIVFTRHYFGNGGGGDDCLARFIYK